MLEQIARRSAQAMRYLSEHRRAIVETISAALAGLRFGLVLALAALLCAVAAMAR